METSRNRSAEGKAFEDDVRNLLVLMGYRFTPDVLIGGKQIDLLAEIVLPGGIQVRLIVECKHLCSGTVGNTQVYEFSSVFNAVKTAHSITGAILVSNAQFTRFARQAAEAASISLLTRDELLASVADFRPYLQGVVDDYESSELNSGYVKLRYCTPHQLRNLEKMADPERRKRLQTQYSSLVDDYLTAWLSKEPKRQVLLLGDYGTGKTTVARHFCYLLAKNYLHQGPPARIPLLICLRDYARGRSARQLMTDFLVNTCRTKIDYETFGRLNVNGHFMLFLDGFDEMFTHVDTRATAEMLRTLSEFCTTASRVVVTGRPGFFPSRDKLEAELRIMPPADVYERALSESVENRIPYYEHVYLLPLTKSQIVEFIKQREPRLSSIGGLTCEQIMQTIEATYNLIDLSERPVLLDLIVKTLPKLADDIQNINVERLYYIYTNFWLEREEEKGRTLISRTDKVTFVEHLAVQMFTEGRMAVHYRDLSPHIKKHFRISEADTLDHFANDIRTCSFLNRDSAGNYYFAHKSFMEYFTARRVASEIQESKNWNFGRKPITQEILHFIDLMLREEDRRNIFAWLAPPAYGSTGGGTHTAANVVALLFLHGVALANVGLRGQIVEEIDLTGANLAKADLGQCRMARSVLAKADLAEACLEHADLTGVSLRMANLVNANLEGATLNGADLAGARLDGANLAFTLLAGIRGWEKVESFQGTNLASASGLKYEDADLALVRGAVGRPILTKQEEERKARSERKKRTRKMSKRK